MPARSPLWWHPSGQWCKKHRGRAYYFGTGSLEDALARYLAEWPQITAGVPRGRPGDPTALTVAALANKFLHAKRQRVDAGELTPEVWRQYRWMAERVLRSLGRVRPVSSLTPTDFGKVRADAAAGLCPSTLTTFLKLARAMFAFGGELLDRPPRYGGQFAPPPARVLRLRRAAGARRLLEPAKLRALLDAAAPPLRAQILLGLNCAFGSTDCSELRDHHLERPGWVVMVRRKTGTARRCPLWPETTEALKVARSVRPRPLAPADADRVFLSPRGRPCKRDAERPGGRGSRGDWIGAAWKKLCRRAGVEVPRGSSFYLLRHIFRTVADQLPDRTAIDLVMGHADTSMASHYVERVGDERLEAVTQHVRRWLWPRKR